MSINDELAAWGETPQGSEETEEADLLERLLTLLRQGEAPQQTDKGKALIQLYESTSLFRNRTGLLDHLRTLDGWTLEGQPPLPDPDALPDPFPGEFRIRELLGEGAFGQVWLADDLKLGRPVALKTLRCAGHRTRLAALQHEAGILAQMEHRNLVRVHAWRESGGNSYLVMQYVPGGSLGDRLKKEGPLHWETATRYIADVAEGLLEVHARGIIHRDIKPPNILWHAQRDEALLADFGIAAHLADGQTAAGTWPYMAPEGFYVGSVSPKLDVYGLAATLFELVTGKLPFSGDTAAAYQEAARAGLPTPDPRCADLPAPLEQLIREGLAADPHRRPSLKDFAVGLRGGLNQLLSDSFDMQKLGGSPVTLRLAVSRESAPGKYVPVASTRPGTVGTTRNMKRVPPPPAQIHLKTGDRVRVEVESDRTGHVTVFNVGPTGELNLLFPDDLAGVNPSGPPTIHPGQILHVLDVQMEPPTGRERVFALWTARPLTLRLEQLQELATKGQLPVSAPYVATRNMKKVKKAVEELKPEEWGVVVLEVDHGE
jgi:serine/threonine protein kinase